MTETLLTTKLYIPERPRTFLARSRLLNPLNDGLNGKLILVSAPAGFGKTTLIANWAQTLEHNIAWLSLNTRDSEPSLFWSYIIAALRHAGAGGISDHVQQLLSSDASDSLEPALITLINGLASTGTETVLVLDDYHVITDPVVHKSMTFLLEHLPPKLTLVLLTRADPPFPLARLRARGTMVEIRAADLRFRTDEAADFMQRSTGSSLDNTEIAALEERTEGWAVGLQLAALAVQNHDDPSQFVQMFAGSHHYIVEYLTEEVLTHQPANVRDFLLKTAVLDELTAPLCDAVTGHDDGVQMLEYLLENNLFLISLDPAQTWYRYHHLFADLLRHRLRQTRGKDEIQELYRRASRWYEKAGQAGEAIPYALDGAVYEDAVRQLEAHWHSVAHRGALRTLRRWLDALPDDLCASSAPLNMAACWLHYLSGEHDKIEQSLEQAQRAWDARTAAGTVPDREAWVIIPSLLASVRAIVALRAGDPEAGAHHAKQALALIPEHDERVNRDLLLGTAAYRLVQAYQQLGQLESAVDAMHEVLVHLKRGENFVGVVNGVHSLVEMHLELGQPDAAREACKAALDFMGAHGHTQSPLVGMIHVALAEVDSSEGQTAAAAEHLSRALALAEPSGYAPVLSLASELRRQVDARVEQPLVEPLTDRELEVLQLLCDGCTNQQIADELVIAVSTVKKHAGNIYGKLDVNNRTQAVLRAQELDLL